jgi:8-oxo-dGTP pyrophosphatase MutT (NUDIX family)
VLVLVADDEHGGAGVLLTRRSTALRNHSGEISFPGGRVDPGETDVAAALREANEEVGLDAGDVEIIGELDHLATVVSRSYIVPVVGRAARQLPLTPRPTEVERVMWVPLAELVRADTYRAERWRAPWGERVLYFFELDDETIWGATAHILVDLLRRLDEPSSSAVTRPRSAR